MNRRWLVLIYAAFYLLYGSLAVRSKAAYWNTPSRGFVFIALLISVLLLTSEPWLTSRVGNFSHLYLFLQCGIILALLLIPEKHAYFANLFIPLCFHGAYRLPRKAALAWVGFISVCVVISLVYLFGWIPGLAYALGYLAACFFVTVSGMVMMGAQEAQQKNRVLQGELRTADEKLRAYSARIEKLMSLPLAPSPSESPVNPARIHYADLLLDVSSHELVRGEQAVSISPICFQLLQYFIQNPGRVISKEELLKNVWSYHGNSGSLNLVEAAITRLRREIDDDPEHPRYIFTIRGTGYRFGAAQ